MRYHNITTCDMLNGDGLRVVLWVSGCELHCPHCQNPETWDPNDGLVFDEKAKNELFGYLDNDYISGITFSGGHPLYPDNIKPISELIMEIKEKFPDKNIWLYTGLEYKTVVERSKTDVYLSKIIENIDVLVDGKFIYDLRDSQLHWVGSSNQHVIHLNKHK